MLENVIINVFLNKNQSCVDKLVDVIHSSLALNISKNYSGQSVTAPTSYFTSGPHIS